MSTQNLNLFDLFWSESRYDYFAFGRAFQTVEHGWLWGRREWGFGGLGMRFQPDADVVQHVFDVGVEYGVSFVVWNLPHDLGDTVGVRGTLLPQVLTDTLDILAETPADDFTALEEDNQVLQLGLADDELRTGEDARDLVVIIHSPVLYECVHIGVLLDGIGTRLEESTKPFYDFDCETHSKPFSFEISAMISGPSTARRGMMSSACLPSK